MKIHIKATCSFIVTLFFFNQLVFAQYKDFQLGHAGDTINGTNKQGKKMGKWVIVVPALRGEPGYTEEGSYNKEGQKEGYWRKYNDIGDLLAMEFYKNGEKAGLQQYYNYLGDLEHDENWLPYNPEHPFDTIPIYGEGNNEIIEYRAVKVEPYSVKDGEWHYYEPGTGKVIRTEVWDKNAPVKRRRNTEEEVQQEEKPKKIEKTPEMLEWERKNKKKRILDGRTVPN